MGLLSSEVLAILSKRLKCKFDSKRDTACFETAKAKFTYQTFNMLDQDKISYFFPCFWETNWAIVVIFAQLEK